MNDACDISHRPEEPDQNPTDQEIATILRDCKKIAIVGLSNKPERASHGVGLYMREKGYTIYAVHPNIAEWEGQAVYRTLSDLGEEIDMVDLFLAPRRIDAMVTEIIAAKPKVVWMQLGVVNNEAARKLRDAGITVVQNKCLKIEHSRSGE